MWVKQLFDVRDVRALYTNIITDQRIEETRLGQCFDQRTGKLVSAPADFYTPKEFQGWDFYTGGNIIDDDEEDEAVLSYGTYCCDGDGFVSVLLLVDGQIQLLDQGDYMLDLSPNLDEAMTQAAEYLRGQYPEIYEERLA
jgi:hypothetical protein